MRDDETPATDGDGGSSNAQEADTNPAPTAVDENAPPKEQTPEPAKEPKPEAPAPAPAKAVADEGPVALAQSQKLTQDRLQNAESKFTRWDVSPRDGVSAQDMLRPEFWAHVSKQLRPKDRLEATAEDGSWFAEFFVLSQGPNWAKVAMLRHVRLSDSTPLRSDDYEAIWGGPALKYTVRRTADKEVIQKGFDTMGDAGAWLSQFQKAA